jgi:hypothetical protein
MRLPQAIFVLLILICAPQRGEASVRLFYLWGSDHPSTLRTRLGGTGNLAPAAFRTMHVSRTVDALEVRWKAHPGTSCAQAVSTAVLDQAAGTMADWASRPAVRDALRHRATEITVYLVPEGKAFLLREAVFRRLSPTARVAFGTHVPCSDPLEVAGRASAVAAHELMHMDLHSRHLPIVVEEAMAYTAQACAWLDAVDRLPAATEVAHRLPRILLDLFEQDSPGEFLSTRFRNEPNTSLRGGVLSQLNLGLFLGASPIGSAADPRSGSVRNYCACVDASIPDFVSEKPGEIWRQSGGTSCTLSAPATAPHNGR